jgi:hypothetical protein
MRANVTLIQGVLCQPFSGDHGEFHAMPIQTRLIPALLASILFAGCAGDEVATVSSTDGTETATEATAKGEGVEAPAATEKAKEEPATIATMAYANSDEAASLSAGGPDSPMDICWSKAESADASSYTLSGTIKLAPARRPDVDQLVLVATDAPISKWKSGGVVPIYSVGVTMPGAFKLEVKSGPKALYLCAFAPPTFDDNQTFMVAGCTADPIEGKAGAATTSEEVELVIAARENPLVTIGGADFGTESWTGDRVKRTVSGTVKGVKAAAFVIATAPTPILEDESSDSEPLGMAIAGPDGVFSLSYFAAPREPLYVCAMAFDDAKAPSSLSGMGCSAVDLPEAGPQAAREFKDLNIEINAEAEELDEDDKSHVALLQRCFASK